jgi:hypothetical protein
MKEGEPGTGEKGGDMRSGKRVAFKISAKIIELIEMRPKGVPVSTDGHRH